MREGISGARSFQTTGGIAAVATDAAAIVTLLLSIEDRVAAAGERTIDPATGIQDIRVPGAVIALLAGIELFITAELRTEAAADALVRERRIVDGWLALFGEERLDDAVAADALLEEAI